ncbi:CD1375 family protein [Huintestinicola sp.]
MVRIYVYCVKCGKMSVDNVPAKWRDEVRKEIDENG